MGVGGKVKLCPSKLNYEIFNMGIIKQQQSPARTHIESGQLPPAFGHRIECNFNRITKSLKIKSYFIKSNYNLPPTTHSHCALCQVFQPAAIPRSTACLSTVWRMTAEVDRFLIQFRGGGGGVRPHLEPLKKQAAHDDDARPNPLIKRNLSCGLRSSVLFISLYDCGFGMPRN